MTPRYTESCCNLAQALKCASFQACLADIWLVHLLHSGVVEHHGEKKGKVCKGRNVQLSSSYANTREIQMCAHPQQWRAHVGAMVQVWSLVSSNVTILVDYVRFARPCDASLPSSRLPKICPCQPAQTLISLLPLYPPTVVYRPCVSLSP